jgi:hypothetical protein
MKFKSVAEVLAAKKSKEEELAATEKSAVEALYYIFQEQYSERRAREIVIWQDAFNFKPDPEDEMACKYPEHQGLLERVDFYPDRVEVQVCVNERWYDEQHDHVDRTYESVTLFTGEKAATYFNEVAEQFINQAKKGPATMLFTEHGFPDLGDYLFKKKEEEAFHQEWNAKMTRKKEACGCDQPAVCDCTIPF